MDDLEEVEAGDRMEMGVAMELGEDDMVVVVVEEEEEEDELFLFERREVVVREGMLNIFYLRDGKGR